MFHKVAETRGLRSQTEVKSKPRKWISSNIYNGLSQIEMKKKKMELKPENEKWIYSGDSWIFFSSFFQLFFLSSFQCLTYDIVINDESHDETWVRASKTKQKNPVFNIFSMLLLLWLFVVIVMCELWVYICKRLKCDEDHHLSIARENPVWQDNNNKIKTQIITTRKRI